MSVSRNAPCPCGSGKKYKKCCLGQEEKRAAEARREATLAREQRLLKQVAGHDPFINYALELEELSNRANDLTCAGQWEEAEACCRELLERFPDEIDGHHRLYACCKASGDYLNAKTHAEATLAMVEARDGFDPSFPAGLKEDIAHFEKLLAAEGPLQ